MKLSVEDSAGSAANAVAETAVEASAQLVELAVA